MTSMYKHTCRHTQLEKFLRHKHATPNAFYLQCLSDYIQCIVKLFRTQTRKTLDILCSSISTRASRLTLCFCLIAKAYQPVGLGSSVPLSSPGEETQLESDDPVHACQSLQQGGCKQHQFAMAGGPSGRREAKKVLKTSQAVLTKEGLVCSSPSTPLPGGAWLGSSLSASAPSCKLLLGSWFTAS